MPSQFTSQIKIVPDQQQQHISVGLESLSRNLTKIQALKDIDDKAKIDRFNKMVDISLEGFWQRDKDELFKRQQEYIGNVKKAYKEHGKGGMLPYEYQSELDKQKADLMGKLEQSKADAEWYKSFVRQVSWDKTGKVDVEKSIAPLKEWMILPIEKRVMIDKSSWFKLKEEEINLQKEIGDMAEDFLHKSEDFKIVRDDKGNIDHTKIWEAVADKDIDALAENIMRNDRFSPLLKKKWENPDVQAKHKSYTDFVKSYIPGQGAKTAIKQWSKGGKSDGLDRYDPNANNQYNYFPTTDTVPETLGDPNSKQGTVTSRTSIPVGTPYTQKGKKMTIESVKVVPTAKKRVKISIPGILHVPKTQKKKGGIIFDNESQDYTDNTEDKAVVVVSHIKEKTVLIQPNNPYSKTKVIKTKVYETVPYDDDIRAYLIKSDKFGEKLDGYINGVVNQASGSTPNDGLY